MRICIENDCDNIHLAKGYCRKHYNKRTRHGFYNSYGYYIHRGILRRCYNKDEKSYKNYGGRGIRVCERWHDVHKFIEDMGVRPDGTSLDRIDNNGNYEPSNCRWATQEEQCQNARKNIFTPELVREIRTLYKEKKFRSFELAKMYNIRPSSMHTMLRNKTWKNIII